MQEKVRSRRGVSNEVEESRDGDHVEYREVYPDIVVQWFPDQNDVGLAVETHDGTALVDAFYGKEVVAIGHLLIDRLKLDMPAVLSIPDFPDSDSEREWYALLGRHMLDSVTAATGSYAGYWSWLDRPAVNRLIRLLRKARDTSFGKDE